MSTAIDNNTQTYSPTKTTSQQREEATKKNDSMDFMKLLVAQLTNQDPLSPMENMDFTSQIAHLQALEEQVAMPQAMKDMRSDAQAHTAASMFGKEVTGLRTAHQAATGVGKNDLLTDGD